MIAELYTKPGQSSVRQVDTIYELQLNEILRHPEWNIARVPGGWIYYNDTFQPVFVPFNNEFIGKSV